MKIASGIAISLACIGVVTAAPPRRAAAAYEYNTYANIVRRLKVRLL